MRRAAALTVLAALAGGSGAQEAALPGVGLWLEPAPDGGVVALLRDRRAARVAPDGAVALLDGSWRGRFLRRCEARVLGVGGDGRLADLLSADRGPPASPDSRPACLPDGRVAVLAPDGRALLLLDAALATLAERPVAALPDADPVALAGPDGGAAIALLEGPTDRYRHGVLGDALEAAAVAVYAADAELAELGRWEAPAAAAIEQRRALPFPADGGPGLLVTVSDARGGARYELLALHAGGLEPAAAGPPVGRGARWRNLFAAAHGVAWGVRTPHIGGPLERVRRDGAGLVVEDADVGVTNHVLGSRNLDLGALLPAGDGAPARLVLPSGDLRELRLVVWDEAGALVVATRPLGARLASNVAVTSGPAGPVAWAADEAGTLHRWALDASPP